MKNKAFGLWSTIFLGIGSMGIIAFLSGYSLAKLALRYPSRGGIVEYLVQEFNVNIFSGGMSVMCFLDILQLLPSILLVLEFLHFLQ
ncbi:hypothetical protein [Lebetimonas sp. JS032]|uniref:hypothetical protein n=1 Tax=Lebetimonas sp. JS032 TaxID=990070 RepID=UPI0004643F10|nr:hypothetical protein [Lebetimonas sp. JS032]